MARQRYSYSENNQRYNYNSLWALIIIGTALVAILSFIFVKFFRCVYRYHLLKESLISLAVVVAINISTYYIANYFFYEHLYEVFAFSMFITISVYFICWYLTLKPYLDAENVVNEREEHIARKREEQKKAIIWQAKEYWLNLDPYEFESEVAKIFQAHGYKTNVTQGSGDGGVDIIMSKDGKTTIVQCKHYQNPVPPEPIRALWGCKDDFNADEVILVASSGITEGGKRFVRSKDNFRVLTLDDIILMSKQIVIARDTNKE